MAAGARDRGSDHASLAQAPARAARLAEAARCADQAAAAPMEHVFGTLKRGYGYRTVRYSELARSVVEMGFICMTYSLRRAARLQPLAGG